MTEKAWARHRQWLLSAYQEASRSFDKAIMTLAGGALGISIAFIRDVAPEPVHKWALWTAWLLLASSLLLILASFLASQRAILDMVRQIDANVETVTRGRAAKATDCLNVLAAVSFVSGVVFLAIFALYNL